MPDVTQYIVPDFACVCVCVCVCVFEFACIRVGMGEWGDHEPTCVTSSISNSEPKICNAVLVRLCVMVA